MAGICAGSQEQRVEHLLISQGRRIAVRSLSTDTSWAQEHTALLHLAFSVVTRDNTPPSPVPSPAMDWNYDTALYLGKKWRKEKQRTAKIGLCKPNPMDITSACQPKLLNVVPCPNRIAARLCYHHLDYILYHRRKSGVAGDNEPVRKAFGKWGCC